MRLFFFLTLPIFVGVTMAQNYPTLYDSVNIERILENDRMVNSYLTCLLDKGPCSVDGRELKKVTSDALSNNCARCTDRQKTMAKIVSRFLIAKRPAEWEMIRMKYDPHNQYAERMNEFLHS